MPLMLVEKDEKTCPVIVCDVCDKEIADVGSGCYVWNVLATSNGGRTSIAFAHRGRCCRVAVDAANEDGLAGDIALQAFVVFLLANLGVDPRSKLPAQWLEHAAWMSGL